MVYVHFLIIIVLLIFT